MNKCFCCDCDVETEMSDNPVVISTAYGGLFFRSMGNYGSTTFDPRPSGRDDLLQIIICDECIKKNAKRVTRIYNIKETMTADSGPFVP